MMKLSFETEVADVPVELSEAALRRHEEMVVAHTRSMVRHHHDLLRQRERERAAKAAGAPDGV